MPADDRENRFEKALARHLRADAKVQDVPAFHVCADPEILAAYHERSLAPQQMLSAKQHIEACERCREILAGLAATDEIPFSVSQENAGQEVAGGGASVVHVLKPHSASLWRWVAPAGALAAALLVWVAVREPTLQLPPKTAKAPQNTEVAKTFSVPLPPPAATPPAAAAAPSGIAATRKQALAMGALAGRRISAPMPHGSLANSRGALSKDKESLAVPVEALPILGRDQSDLALQQRYDSAAPLPESDRNVQNLIAGISQPQPAETKPQAKKTDPLRPSAAPMPAPPVGTGGAIVNSTASEVVEVAPAAPAQAESRAKKSAGAPSGANATVQLQEIGGTPRFKQEAQMRLANSTDAVTFTAPGGTVSWRVGAAGIIQHSSDSGKTWILQPSGVINELLAGSAPSEKVCWIVGRAGTILRTTDGGAHWQKMHAPVQDDLLRVFAVDARQAIVSPALGTYQTTDAGATWHKQAPE